MRPDRPKCAYPGCESASTRFFEETGLMAALPGLPHGRCPVHAWSCPLVPLGLREISWGEYAAIEVHGS